MSKLNLKRLFYILILILILVFLSYREKNLDKKNIKPVSEDLVVYFIDVGEADATLISSNGHYMLVDAGNNEDGKPLVKYFAELGIEKFDYLVCTHPHEDHIGGMDNIIREFDIGKYYMADVKLDNMTYTEVIKYLKEKKIPYEEPKVDSEFDLGKAKVKVLYADHTSDNLNDNTVILKISYEDTSLIITGDASTDVENKILNKDIKSTVLRVGHHGSNDSTSANFLYKVHPEYSIISVGKDNDYYHPHKVTLDKLNKINSKVYRTDLDGTIIMTSDGKNISFKTVKTDTDGE